MFLNETYEKASEHYQWTKGTLAWFSLLFAHSLNHLKITWSSLMGKDQGYSVYKPDLYMPFAWNFCQGTCSPSINNSYTFLV